MAEKVFKLRNEPLSEKLEKNEDFKNFYNLCVIILTTFLVDTVIRDYARSNKYQFGFRLILVGFNKFHVVILIWCVLNISALATFSFFSLWANIRCLLTPKKIKFWDQTWLLLLITYYIFSLYGIQEAVKFFKFKPCSALLLLMEQVRLLMKQHAFIRTNAAQILRFKIHSDQNFHYPKIQKYVYFLFAPTLIYRDEYPRTKNIRWKIVLYKVAGLFYVIWGFSLGIDAVLVPHFENICIQKITVVEVISLVVGNGFVGGLVVLCMFYLVLHSSQIIFAELLQFGDRMFYQDWWTSKSFLEFARKWNTLVQDWLYFYVFKDVYLLSKNKLLSNVVLLVMSATVHDWIIINGLNFFSPLAAISFLVFIIFKMLIDPFELLGNNFIFLFSVFYIVGIYTNLFVLELFARLNCPLENNSSFYNSIQPRIITSSCIKNV